MATSPSVASVRSRRRRLRAGESCSCGVRRGMAAAWVFFGGMFKMESAIFPIGAIVGVIAGALIAIYRFLHAR